MSKKRKPTHLTSTDCPCGLNQPYEQCCAPYHLGVAAKTAEQLMRSRYCAYVLKDYAYLRATWQPDTCSSDLGEHDELQQQTKWLGLNVLRAWDGADEDEAFVEFVAKCKIGGGGVERLHEVSRFVRVQGRWLYVDGVFPADTL